MTALRQTAIRELEKLPEDKLVADLSGGSREFPFDRKMELFNDLKGGTCR